LALGLGLEAKGTGGGAIWAWMVLEVVVTGQVATALGRGGALETSDVLLLELEGVPERGEGILPLLLRFWLVTRVKATSSASGVSTDIRRESWNRNRTIDSPHSLYKSRSIRLR